MYLLASHNLKKKSVCNVCIFPSLACAGFEDFLAAQLFLYPLFYGLFEIFCMGVLRKILILPTTPSLSNKNSFLQIVCTSFGVLIVFYFHIYMVCLNDSAWVFFGKFQFCLPPLPSTQEKKFSKLSVPVLKFFRLFYCFLIPYMVY